VCREMDEYCHFSPLKVTSLFFCRKDVFWKVGNSA